MNKLITLCILLACANYHALAQHTVESAPPDTTPAPSFLPDINPPQNQRDFKTDAQLDNLRGKVKTVRLYPMDDSTETNLIFKLKTLWRYDEAGYTTQMLLYNDTISSYMLDVKIQSVFVDHGPYKKVYVVDAKTGAGIKSDIYLYGNRGNVVKRTEGDLHYGTSQQWQYNDVGDEISSEYYGPKGLSIKWTVTYQYNPAGKKTQAMRITVSPTRTDTAIWNYSYDTIGYTTVDEYSWYQGERHKIQSTTLDTANRWVRSYYAGAPGQELMCTAYDQYGNPTQQGVCQPNGTIMPPDEMVYDYDSHRNWIKRTNYANKKVQHFETREIEYY